MKIKSKRLFLLAGSIGLCALVYIGYLLLGPPVETHWQSKHTVGSMAFSPYQSEVAIPQETLRQKYDKFPGRIDGFLSGTRVTISSSEGLFSIPVKVA